MLPATVLPQCSLEFERLVNEMPEAPFDGWDLSRLESRKATVCTSQAAIQPSSSRPARLARGSKPLTARIVQ